MRGLVADSVIPSLVAVTPGKSAVVPWAGDGEIHVMYALRTARVSADFLS